MSHAVVCDNAIHTFMAAVPAYLRLISSPLLSHISLNFFLKLACIIWAGLILPNFLNLKIKKKKKKQSGYF